MIEKKMKAAEAYLSRGWRLFVVSASKRPVANCDRCAREMHVPGGCPCLTCHGFYAATQDVNRIRAMLWGVPGGMLALRTGPASGVVAIDAEGDDKDGFGRTGVEILDEWDSWTGQGADLGDTLRARTSGGGMHLLYAGGAGVGSHNRVLPNVDIKGEGGYVVLPLPGGRTWLNWTSRDGRVDPPGAGLLAFLRKAAGTGAAGAPGGGKRGGALAAMRTSDVIPAGTRYEFTRDLTYHLARNRLHRDMSYAQALEVCRAYWLRYEQPAGWAGGVRQAGGVWFLPFTQMEYELRRAWSRVKPEEPLAFQQMAWVREVSEG